EAREPDEDVKPCRLVMDPDYQPARSIALDPRSLTLVEGQRAPKGLTISVVDRSDASVKPEKLTPKLVWRDPGALAALPGLQAALSAAIVKPKLIEGPGPPDGSATFHVRVPPPI